MRIPEDTKQKLPRHAELNGHYQSILWQVHSDGTLSFTSFRITLDELKKIYPELNDTVRIV